MKTLFSFLLLLLGVNISYSQTRLTSHNSEGSNNKHLLVSEDNANYLISINQSNELSVFVLDDSQNKELLFMQNFQGLFENRNIVKIGNLLVFPTATTIVEYDFTNNTIFEVELPEGKIFSSFLSVNRNRMSISLKNEDQSFTDGIIYEIGGRIFEVDGRVFNLFGDYYEDVIAEQNYTSCTLNNLLTGSVDTICHKCEFSQSLVQVENQVYYYDNTGQAYSFNIETGVSNKLAVDQMGIDNFLSFFIRDDYFITYETNSSEESIQLEIYDTALNKLNSLSLPFGNFLSGLTTHLTGNKLTFINDNELVILNLEDGSYISKSTNINSRYKLIDDRYILNYYRDLSANKFELIDVQNSTFIELAGEYDLQLTPFELQFQKLENVYLIYFVGLRDNIRLFFDLDLDAPSIELNTSLDNSTAGFPERSHVIQLEDNIYLSADQLYQVEGITIKEIFSDIEIQETSLFSSQNYHVSEGKLTVIQNDPKAILSYDGSTVEVEADLSDFRGEFGINDIEFYAIIDDYVLFSDWRRNVYLYEKATKNISSLDFAVDFLGGSIFEYKGWIYFNQWNELYRTNGLEAPELVIDNLSSFLISIYAGHIIFKDQLLVFTDDGMVRINDDGSTLQLGSSFESDPLIAFTVDESFENIITGSAINKIHYDGEEIFEFDMQYGGSTLNLRYNNNIFFFSESDTTGRTNTFFNSESKTYDRLPDEVQDHTILDYFETNGQGYLLTKSGFNPNDQLHIYETDSNFSELNLHREFLDVGWVPDANFSRFYDEGILYTGNHIFVLKEDNEFKLLDKAKGSTSSTIAEQDGDLYFMGIDPLFGLQLFTTKLYSFRTATKDLDSTIYSVFPNPTSHTLQIEELSSTSIKRRFRILNNNGISVLSGLTSGLLDITNLESGAYFLQVQNENAWATSKFVKI